MKDKQCEKNRSLIASFDWIIKLYEEKGWMEDYQKEIEYLAIYHLFIVAMVRVIRIDAHHALLAEFQDYMTEHFPDYVQNPYLYLLDKNKKLVFDLIRRRRYGAVRLLFKIKERIRRSV